MKPLDPRKYGPLFSAPYAFATDTGARCEPIAFCHGASAPVRSVNVRIGDVEATIAMSDKDTDAAVADSLYRVLRGIEGISVRRSKRSVRVRFSKAPHAVK